MSMRKFHKYRGYEFDISVELNTRAERRLNGIQWSTVTITDKSGSYSKEEEIENQRLRLYLKMDVIFDIEKWVDEQKDGIKGLEQELKDLGYK